MARNAHAYVRQYGVFSEEFYYIIEVYFSNKKWFKEVIRLFRMRSTAYAHPDSAINRKMQIFRNDHTITSHAKMNLREHNLECLCVSRSWRTIWTSIVFQRK